MKYILFLLLISGAAKGQTQNSTSQWLIGGPNFSGSLMFWASKDTVYTLTFKYPVRGPAIIKAGNKVELYLASGEVLNFKHSGKTDTTTINFAFLHAIIVLNPLDKEKIMNSRVKKVFFETAFKDVVMDIPEFTSGLINEALKNF